MEDCYQLQTVHLETGHQQCAPGVIWGPTENFNISIHDLIEITDDTKLGSIVDKPDEHRAIQRDHYRLGKWANSNISKSNKEKSKILLLGKTNLKHWYMLGPEQQGSSFAEKDLMVQMDNKLTVSQSHTKKGLEHPELH